MTTYVTVGADGSLTGIFASPQKALGGYAEIDDKDPRIAAFWTLFRMPRITKRQALTWLLLNGGKTEADVLKALNTIADPTAKAQALIAWNYPDGPFRRENPLFDQLGAAIGMKPADLDAAFLAAQKL